MPLGARKAPWTEHSKHIEHSPGTESNPLLSLMAWTCVSPMKAQGEKWFPESCPPSTSGLWHTPVPLVGTPALSFTSYQLTAMYVSDLKCIPSSGKLRFAVTGLHCSLDLHSIQHFICVGDHWMPFPPRAFLSTLSQFCALLIYTAKHPALYISHFIREIFVFHL